MLLSKLRCIVNCNKILYQRTILCKSRFRLLYQRKNNVQVVRQLSITFPLFTLMGVWSFIKPKSEDKTGSTTKEVLARADALFDQGDYISIYNLLSAYKDSEDVEVLWRLCRAIHKISETASEVEAKKMIYEGHSLLCRALDIKEDHYAVHKWIAVFLNSKGAYEGIKAHMKELYNIKKHLMRSIELNSSDATTLYMLGYWCYEIANLPWYQRKIASVVFQEPPTSTFEEALIYYENAEKIDPNFYSRNLLMLGKTYLKLNQKTEAIKYLRKAAEFPAKNDEDQQAKQEAQKILNGI